MSNPPAIIARDAPGFVDCEPIIHPVDRIKNLVMKEFGVTYSDLDGWSRDARVVVPRHVAMSIARRLTTCSLKDISTRFGGRDHTTVVNAVKKLPMRMQCNPVLRERIEKIEAAFRRELAERAERKAVINTPILNAVEPTALELSDIDNKRFLAASAAAQARSQVELRKVELAAAEGRLAKLLGLEEPGPGGAPR